MVENYTKDLKESVYHDAVSIRESTVIQQLDQKRPTLFNSNQTHNRRRYLNFENGSHFICNLNLNNPE